MVNKKQKPSQPTDYKVDAVYVVLCKECKSYLKIGKSSYICGNTFGLCNAKPNDFCSYAKRRVQDGK